MHEFVVVLSLGLLIGAVLGGLGGGGAILTVPGLVYLVGQDAQEATTSSLVIVGLTALVGTASYVRGRRVRWGVGLTFGVVGIPATWLGSALNHRVDEQALLLGFSGLMVLAALAMINDRRTAPPVATLAGNPGEAPAGPSAPRPLAAATRLATRTAVAAAPVTTRPPVVATVLVALAAGLMTGFFGVGGGFVIVPALVLALRLPMEQAVGTSLVIVALNSGSALVSRAGEAHFDWSVMVPFTLAAMVATLLGKRVADRLPARRLQVAFAVLMLLVAGYTAWQSLAG